MPSDDATETTLEQRRGTAAEEELLRRLHRSDGCDDDEDLYMICKRKVGEQKSEG